MTERKMDIAGEVPCKLLEGALPVAGDEDDRIDAWWLNLKRYVSAGLDDEDIEQLRFELERMMLSHAANFLIWCVKCRRDLRQIINTGSWRESWKATETILVDHLGRGPTRPMPPGWRAQGPDAMLLAACDARDAISMGTAYRFYNDIGDIVTIDETEIRKAVEADEKLWDVYLDTLAKIRERPSK